MLYGISLDNGFSGEHFGLVFANEKAHTEDIFLAFRLQSKGYNVTAETIADDETVSGTCEAAEAPLFIDEENFEAAEQFATQINPLINLWRYVWVSCLCFGIGIPVILSRDLTVSSVKLRRINQVSPMTTVCEKFCISRRKISCHIGA